MRNKNLLETAREGWSALILSVAESLPTFNGGVVAYLQETRRHQRDWSDRDFEHSRLPTGAMVTLRGFTLLQLYSLEDLKSMETMIRKRFPNTLKDWRQEIFGDSEALTGSSWAHIGYIAREQHRIFPGDVAIFPNLPVEIEHISVEVRRVLPSLTALAFHVALSDEVSSRLLRLYNSRYLGRITLNHWIPMHRSFGRAEEPAETERERAIAGYLDEIRSKAQNFVIRYFPTPSRPRNLVALDEIHISGAHAAEQEIARSPAWGRQFGFALLGFASFTNTRLASFLPANDSYGRDYPHRLIVWGDPELGSEMKMLVANAIGELIPFLAIIEVLNRAEEAVGRLRRQVFKQMADRRLAAWFSRRLSGSFFREVQLSSAVHLDRVLLARLNLEYQRQKSFLATSREGLNRDRAPNEPGVRALSARVRIRPSARVDTSLRYSVPRLFWLTFFVAIATILGIFGNWESIQCGLKSLWHSLAK